MWTLIALTLLGQTAIDEKPVIAVFPPAVRAEAAPPALIERLGASTRAALEAEGFTLLTPEQTQERLGDLTASDCGTSSTCYALLTERLEVPWALRLDADAVEGDVAILMEAFRPGSRDSVRHLFVARAEDLEAETAEQSVLLARKVSEAHREAPLPDAPRRANLEPAVAPQPPALALETRRSRAPRVLATGGAVVAGAAAIVFAVVGASAQSCLDGPARDGVPTVCVAQAEVPGVQRRARVGLAGAVTSGAIAAALAATAVLSSQ